MHPREVETETRRAEFEAVAVPLQAALYRLAHRLSPGSDEAADLVQETYLRAYRTFQNFAPGTNARAWLFTILYSVFVNRYRRARREPVPVALEELERRFERFVDATEGPELGLVEGWGNAWSPEVEAALRRLPEEFRAPLLLVDVEELSYEEAATALGCPTGTIGSRLHRGRRLLFALLSGFAERAGYPRAPR
jgi:RNA polymerase sigma-70 factor (ECF subfamily)